MIARQVLVPGGFEGLGGMNCFVRIACLSAVVASSMLLVLQSPVSAQPRYAWRAEDAQTQATLEERFPPPPGFERVAAETQSFAEWLRGLPMKPGGVPVLLHTGAPKWRQDVHAGVVDIDVGKRDLQQCADAIMRLRAEWLYSLGRKSDIAFNDTQGKRLRFSARPKQDYPGFRKYMDYVFAYAGTYSLERELVPAPLDSVRAGDVFIKGGFPGHAVLVTDVVVNKATGETRFLLTQSYMPAQEIHVLKNPAETDGSVWYATDFGETLETPEWRFPRQQLKRWKS
jgi:hypothetical protein